MGGTRRLGRWIRALFGTAPNDAIWEVEQRIRLHAQTTMNLRRGMRPERARDAAERELGLDARPGELPAGRRSSWLADLSRDAPYAIRSLRRTPGFTILALLTLAVGIGANAAIFSVVHAVLLRALPYMDSDRLVRVYESLKDQPGWTGSVSVPNLRDWQAQSRTIQQFAAYQSGGRNLEGSGEPERLRAVIASANLFDVVRVPPTRGRTFASDEDQPGRNQVVVLSEGLWRRRFGADPSVINRTIMLDGSAHTVIGVMPTTFEFPAGGSLTDVWLPYTPSENDANGRGNHMLNVVGRLAPGASLDRASLEMHEIAARIEQQYPESQANRTALLVPLHESVVGRVRPALLVLLGAVALVLLIACANVANLLLARSAARRRDVAIRVALGASRGQLVRQYLTESVILSLGGAILGVFAARWSLGALTRLSERALPVAGPIPLDATVFVFLLVVAVACGIAFGLAPALQASPKKLRDELTGGGTKMTVGGQQQRFRSALVVAQIALSLVLLVGAGLLMRAFLALRGTASGLETERVLTMHLAVPRDRYAGSAVTDRLFRPILERMREVPGVLAAGATSMLPIENWGWNGDYWIDGQPWPEPGQTPIAETRAVSPGYFASLGIPIKVGREFTERDDSTRTQVVVINETLAKRHFAGTSAIGRRILRGLERDHGEFEIVGVVGDVRQSGLDSPPRAELFFSYADARQGWLIGGDITMVVKTAVPEASVVPAVREAVRGVAADVPVYAVRSMDEVIGRSLSGRRLNLWLLGIFAAIALVLAASGLYGVISYLVAQRTREIGIRMALGADRSMVVRLVLQQGAVLAAIGISLGLVGAAALTRLLSSMLYGVGARDPLTFASVAGVLGAVAMMASFVPALRASRVDPLVALRAE